MVIFEITIGDFMIITIISNVNGSTTTSCIVICEITIAYSGSIMINVDCTTIRTIIVFKFTVGYGCTRCANIDCTTIGSGVILKITIGDLRISTANTNCSTFAISIIMIIGEITIFYFSILTNGIYAATR